MFIKILEILIPQIFVFLFGLCIGSFLNCIIYRLESGKSFLKGRSFCPDCRHNLVWKDLFPVFSFLFLQGKCRYCKAKISWQYPVVELVTGILFVLMFWKFGFGLTFGFWIYVVSSFIVIFVYDLKHYLIPDKILFPAIVIAFIYKVFVNLSFSNRDFIKNWNLEIGNSASISNLFLAVIISSGFFFVIWAISGGKWMGFGDVKLAILLGLILGFPNILAGLFLSFFFGAIIGVGLMALNKKHMKSEVPFGPFLISGTLVALFWGQNIINWYLNLTVIIR